MAKYTKKDIIQMVEDDDVEFIRLQFTAGQGGTSDLRCLQTER